MNKLNAIANALQSWIAEKGQKKQDKAKEELEEELEGEKPSKMKRAQESIRKATGGKTSADS